MRALPTVPPPGCSLTEAELVEQRGRAARLAPTVAEVVRSGDALVVTFSDEVDRRVLGELIATERSCCAFLSIDYDERDRQLSMLASDAQGREVVSRFDAFFRAEDGR
jgi:hypothetical protein